VKAPLLYNEDCAAQAVFWRKLSDALVMK